MEEGVSLFDTFPRERYPFDEGLYSQKEGMKIPPPIEDQDLRSLIDDGATSIIEEEEGKVGDDNAVMIRSPQAPHGEEDGALAPRRETLTLFQEVPKCLTYRDHSTTHGQHAPSLSNDETLRIEEGEEEGTHHIMRSIYPHLLEEKIRQEDL